MCRERACSLVATRDSVAPDVLVRLSMGVNFLGFNGVEFSVIGKVPRILVTLPHIYISSN